MNADEREQLNYLCARIQLEQVPKAFDELVMELNELLQPEQQRTDSAAANPNRVMKN